MEPVIGAISEQERLFVVRALVEVVAQFVVHGGEVVGVHLNAHLHPQVIDRVHVPCRSVAHHFAIARMHELRTLPEGRRQRTKSKAGKKILAVVDHRAAGGKARRVALVGREVGRRIECGSRRGILFGNLLFKRRLKIDGLELRQLWIGRRHQIVDIAPLLRPHVAQQFRRNHAVGAFGRLAVFGDQAIANVRMQFAIKRFELGPRAFHFGGELCRRHVVSRAPQFARVLVAELSGPDVLQLDKAGILLAHRRPDGMPADPQFREFFRIGRPGHDVRNRVDPHAFGVRRGLLARLGIGAVLALPVHACELGGKLRLFREQLGVFGRGRSVQLQ